MSRMDRIDTAGLRLNRVHKSFGHHEVLKDINLDIRGGEFVVFVGPSGCGKSTLLRLIAGLEEVSAGDIEISGRDVTDTDPSERGIAMVFQTYALYPHMSVSENMGFGLKVARRPRSEIEQKVRSAADILQLTSYLDRRPGQLSGGQRQRVAIGRAIVRDPDVFLFDEPLSNLDAELRVEMRIEIARLHRQLGNTMIYVTHDQTEAMTLADKIVVLRAGRIEQVGSPVELYDDPDNAFVAGFIGSPKMNFLETELSGGMLKIGNQSLPAPVLKAARNGVKARVGIRPEHLRLAGAGDPCLPFRVNFSEFHGGVTYLYGDVDGTQPCTITADRNVTAPAGTILQITADPGEMRIFDQDDKRIR